MISNQISLNSTSIVRVLGIVVVLLVVVSTVGQVTAFITGNHYIYGLVPVFFVGYEHNIPTLFSTFLLLFAALLLSVITVLERNRKASYVSSWAILSFGFLYMAVDEAVSIHEKLIKPVSKLLGDGNLGVFYFAWVIPAILLVLVLALYFRKFLFHLNAKTRLTFVLAAILYIGGCIGVEMMGGRYYELHGSNNLTYKMVQTVEESLEMAGTVLFIWGLLVYIADNYKEVRLRFDVGSE